MTTALQPPITADILRAFLAGRDTPCPACGYNLRDLAGPRCPECNESPVLEIRTDDAFRRPAIAARLVLWLTLLGAVVATFRLLWLFVSVVSGAGVGAMPWLYWVMWGVWPMYLVACPTGLVLGHRRGRRAGRAAGQRLVVCFTLWLIVFQSAVSSLTYALQFLFF